MFEMIWVPRLGELVSRRLIQGQSWNITCGRGKQGGKKAGQKEEEAPENPVESSKAEMPLLSDSKLGAKALSFHVDPSLDMSCP